jgi:hypothetical protein
MLERSCCTLDVKPTGLWSQRFKPRPGQLCVAPGMLLGSNSAPHSACPAGILKLGSNRKVFSKIRKVAPERFYSSSSLFHICELQRVHLSNLSNYVVPVHMYAFMHSTSHTSEGCLFTVYFLLLVQRFYLGFSPLGGTGDGALRSGTQKLKDCTK